MVGRGLQVVPLSLSVGWCLFPIGRVWPFGLVSMC